MLVQTNIRVNIIRILDEICAYCEILCMYNVSLYSIKYVLCICYVCIMYISYTCLSRIYIYVYIYMTYIVDIMYTLHILFCMIVHTKKHSEHMSCTLYSLYAQRIFNFDCIRRILVPFFLVSFRTVSLGHLAIRGAKTLKLLGYESGRMSFRNSVIIFCPKSI